MEEMFWKELIKSRAQNFTWDMTAEVDKELIESIATDIHHRAPSKQNRVQYQMHIFDWSDSEFRNDFYQFAVDRDNPNPRYNPQTLAHYLFVFVGRSPGYFANDFSNWGPGIMPHISHLEIGLASHMLIHGAFVRGLASGFCRCFDYNYTKAPAIATKLNLPSNKADHIFLSVGVGIESYNKFQTFNPFTNSMIPVSKNSGTNWYHEPKPDPAEYIVYHTA